jgi:ribosomal protein S18 acetylase RimI-like enzyme
LKEAPYAFSSWLERELEYEDDLWESRAEQSGLGEQSVAFVAIEEERSLGMAGGFFDEGEQEIANLYGMWVEPGARRGGLGRALVDAIADWARESGARSLRLSVTDCDEAKPALAFYRDLGFEETGEIEHPESNRPLTAIVMSRSFHRHGVV